MLNLVLYDNKNKIEKHITLKRENNKITVSGYAREKGKKKSLSKNIQNELIDLIKLKDFSKYIGEVEGYKLYEDEYEYIHFFKEGKEDYSKFLLFNGRSAVLNSEPNNKSKNNILKNINQFLREVNNMLKKPLLLGLTFYTAGVILSLAYIPSSRLELGEAEQMAIEWEAEAQYVECTSVDDIIARINMLDLTEDEKNILTNREQLETAFEYSDEEICDKLAWGVYTMYCNNETSAYLESANGFHTTLTPYTLYLRDNLEDEAKDSVTTHEYDHYLQNPSCPLFLKEMHASEVEENTYGYCNNGYYIGSINYGLIRTLVGDEAIKEYVYDHSENCDKKFKEELSKYISESSYKELIKLLDCKESKMIATTEYQQQLYKFLLGIVEAKYGKESVQQFETFVGKIGIPAINHVSMSFLEAEELNLLIGEEHYYQVFSKEITLEEYNAFNENKSLLDLYNTKISWRLTEKASKELAKPNPEIYFSEGEGYFFYKGKNIEYKDAQKLGYMEKVYYHTCHVYEGEEVPVGYEPWSLGGSTTTWEYLCEPIQTIEPSNNYRFSDSNHGNVTYKINTIFEYILSGANEKKQTATNTK